jgi:hypothetical protein
MFVTFIEGEDVATYENGTIKGLKEGTATFMVGFKARTDSGKPYVLYTQPITVNVNAAHETSSNGNTLEIIIYVVCGLIIVLGATYLIMSAKKKGPAKE